jgi:hypothetical protein
VAPRAAARQWLSPMETAYLHVVINHLPIMGVPIALGLLLLGAWSRSEAIKHAALLAFVALGVATIAVYLTGHGGEDFVERAPGVSHEAIERHEEMATVAFVAVESLALLALACFVAFGGLALLARRPTGERRIPVAALALVVLVAAATTAILGYTGRLGGRISHTEFSAAGAEAREADADDDDGRRRRRRRGRDD